MSGTNALMGAGAPANLLQITDPNMTAAQWVQFAQDPRYQVGANGGGNPLGVPSDQWGPFGLTPPPGSPAAHDYWMQLQYGENPPTGVAPMDPAQYTNMYERMTANTSAYGGGMQVPVGVEGSPFNPTPGNPNFTINPAGYGELTDQGNQNLNAYALDQLQGIYENAAKNRSGLSGFMGTPAGAAAILGFPALVGGAGAALAAGAAAAPEATSGLSSFIANPLTATTGLPSWVSPALKGVDVLRQLLMQRTQSQT